MSIADRVRLALGRGKAAASRPQPGQVVRAGPQDTWRDYVAEGLTPAKLAGILKAADAGDLQAAMDLYEQMEEKDAHLFSVANTRRLALTGLPWQVVSAADVIDGVDRAAADEAAHYCREVLAGLEDLDEVLQHLSLALGRNVSVAELVWDLQGDGHRLAGIVPVPFGRLSADSLGQAADRHRRGPGAGDCRCRPTSLSYTCRRRPRDTPRGEGCCASRRWRSWASTTR